MEAPDDGTRGHHPTWRSVAAAAALVLVAAACGGDDPALEVVSENTPTPAETQDGDDAPDETPAATPGDDDSDDATEPTDDAPTPEPTTDGDEPEPTAAPGEIRPTPTQAPISGDPAFTSASKLTTVGLDEVFFGDPVDDAAEKASTTWVGLPSAGSEPQCYTVQPAGGPAGIVFTVVDGRIERVDISTETVTTRSGAGVGSTEAQLTELFGSQLETGPTAGGSEIAFVPVSEEDKVFRIIWVTDGSVVTSMRAGRLPYVQPATPCSG